jgi:hypothetical protein
MWAYVMGMLRFNIGAGGEGAALMLKVNWL